MYFKIISLILCFGCCHGMSNQVERHYNMLLGGTRLADSTAAFSNISRIRCCALCTRQVSCYYVNFHSENSSCELTSGWDAVFSDQVFEGWDVYSANVGCPHSMADFEPVGAVAIALCHHRLVQTEALLQCASVAGARLVQPDTAQKFQALRNYVITRPHYDSYLSKLTDGQFASGSWRFANGLPVPMEPTLFLDGIVPDGTKPCLRLKMFFGGLWQGAPCDKARGYICEVDIQ